MREQKFDSFLSMSEYAAEIVVELLTRRPKALFCAATGHSPSQLYHVLSGDKPNGKRLFATARIVQLDEWLGLPAGSSGTCEHYLEEHLYTPLSIAESRRIAFQSDCQDPLKECLRVDKELDIAGPIDLCILGLGKNGHIGLNEPANELTMPCHVVDLSQKTLLHNMLNDVTTKPNQGITLGMDAIMKAKHILLLVAGEGKEEALDRLLSGKISSNYPASFLQLHQNVDCLIGI
jgi:galactosamine-6-phosphate isomerase